MTHQGHRIVVCKDCEEKKFHEARGLCRLCYQRSWRQANPEKKQAYDCQYRERVPRRIRRAGEDSNKIRVQKCRYREGHQEEIAIYGRRWKQENPDKVAIQKARRKAYKFAAANTLTQGQIEFEKKIGEATYPGEKLSLHHIVSFSKGGGHTWGNIAFIPASLNSSIGDSLPEEVYEQLSF